ncbi:hypothetical protein [Burkholderia gladioli]|uniref:hypothetical protein n=1 Tax=Burkholderia gladioli TaxID=28095 RepID=UPI0020B2724C|nr:hypothetical protein [Burkholderia gladioli]
MNGSGRKLGDAFLDSEALDDDSGWNELGAGNETQKEKILKLHFPRALERFNAGVSLSKIRQHYEKLGAKYSPVTFRKKWIELVKTQAKNG